MKLCSTLHILGNRCSTLPFFVNRWAEGGRVRGASKSQLLSERQNDGRLSWQKGRYHDRRLSGGRVVKKLTPGLLWKTV